ncbi:MAG: malate synthase G [Acidimicrobiales bacterium]
MTEGSHRDATAYAVVGGSLEVVLADATAGLADPTQFVGYAGGATAPTSVLLRKHGLHADIRIDRFHPIGRDDAAIADIDLESAVSTIMDCEDSVSRSRRRRQGRRLRQLARPDEGRPRHHSSRRAAKPSSASSTATATTSRPRRRDHPSGRSLMCSCATSGTTSPPTPSPSTARPIAETILDAMITALAAKHDLLGHGMHRNSRAGSIYIVKPKMHGPDEVAWACELFSRVEDALGLDRHTLKMGIMDEDRRTSLNLAAAIDQAKDRIVFINTGFLDRTGDEIHTDMEAGAVLPKGEMKGATWLLAYEDANVDTGLACGLQNRAQIGKGMWAKPSEMAEMVETKIGHPSAGATCAWVPSPTAATLHATHYFEVNVAARQEELLARTPRTIDDLTAIPLLDRELSAEQVQTELDNNAQSILGYIVRWVGIGVGCSTVPDIADVGLMEDLATLRISSQHVANWLHHGVISEAQIRETFARMAGQVDQQNADDAGYRAMTADLDGSIPFQAALELVLTGRNEQNGYTERILRKNRRAAKAATR